ncbi:MAG: queuosine precursor transporter [Propionibacteriaceae bacterium]|nr:queuosine precursor transporter [Propionibacteriaceae bacterium]
MSTLETGQPKHQGNYDIVLALFCGLLLISNIGATKLIAFGPDFSLGGYQLLPILTDGGAILFPMTYILGDVLAEVFGLKKANRAIFTAFALSVLMSLTFFIVDLAPTAGDWDLKDSWHAVLGFVPRIVIASLLAYLAGQLLNALVLVRIRDRWGERRLWVRLISSTVVGEFADTVIFGLVAFGPVGAILDGESIGFDALLNYVVAGWIYKVLVEVALLPVTYNVIKAIKKRESPTL